MNIDSAIQQTNAQFQAAIKYEVMTNMKHGTSYLTLAKDSDSWRTLLKYTPEHEQFLMDKTRLFITTLPGSPAYNLAFLNPLINLIATHLATYTVRGHNENTFEQERDRLIEKINASAHMRHVIAKHQKRQASKAAKIKAKELLEQESKIQAITKAVPGRRPRIVAIRVPTHEYINNLNEKQR